jgi:hypothetical protein
VAPSSHLLEFLVPMFCQSSGPFFGLSPRTTGRTKKPTNFSSAGLLCVEEAE